MSTAKALTPIPTGDLKCYEDALAAMEERLARALAHLKGKSAGLAPGQDLIDQHQLAVYDLAFFRAELSAARAVQNWAASQSGASAPFCQSLAGAVVADTLTQLRLRLGARALDYGFTREALEAPFSGLIDDALQRASDSEALERLGEALLARQGDLGPLELPEATRMMRDTFERFATDVVAPQAEAIHRQDLTIPEDIIEGLKALGCFGLSVPERFGGLLPDDREDTLGMIVATEALSKASLGAAGSLITRPEILARALLAGGTDAQKAHWLPRIATGEPLVAISVTEPGTGSDVASVALRASRCEGGWRLNGAKTWCTFAGKAELILVLARTDPDPQAGHRGLSLFLVEKPSTTAHEFAHQSPGGGEMSGRAIPTLGYRGMHSFEMFYDDFFVPDSHVLGGEEGLGKGFYYQMRGFSGGRIQTAARATGLMQAAFEAALRYSQDRKVFGQSVADYGLSKVKLARMAMALQSARLLTLDVGKLLDAGEGQMEASLVKLYACRAAETVCRGGPSTSWRHGLCRGNGRFSLFCGRPRSVDL